jgi:hypothetical protein
MSDSTCFAISTMSSLFDRQNSITRIARAWHEKDAEHDGETIGYWYRLFVYNNPINSMLDVFFVGLNDDPGIRAAAVLAERLEG